MRKQACIVHVEADLVDLGPLRAKLEAQGFDVTLIPLPADEVDQVRAGELPPLSEDIQSKLREADLVVVLISPQADNCSALGTAGQAAVSGHGDIIGIWPSGSEQVPLPRVLLDFGCDVIGEDDPGLTKVLEGSETSWKGPEDKPVEKAKSSHQPKC